MTRLAIAAILFISLFVMMRGIATTWRGSNLPESAVVSQRPGPASSAVPKKIIFQPKVPETLPDLKTGYLFNAERLLVGNGTKNGEEGVAASNDLGIQTDIQAVIYSGSIIGDTFRQAILAVPSAKSAVHSVRSFRWRKTSRPSTNIKNIRVKEGDVLSGYTVAAISPEKIIFEKGAEKVEKLLYDPDKKRVVPSRQTRTGSRFPARPDVVAKPAGTPSSRPSALQRQAIRIPTPATRRRLIVTRKPPTMPDTSKVVRRRPRSLGGTKSIDIPPMPAVHP